MSTPRTDAVWRAQRFDQHIQAINAANALVKHARILEEELAAALAVINTARCDADDDLIHYDVGRVTKEALQQRLAKLSQA